MIPFGIVASLSLAYFGMLFAVAVGLLGGYLPARRAARVKLIDLLRE